jgi:ferritin
MTKPTIPAKITQEIVTIFNERLKDEYTAHYVYTCAANWCLDAGYLKAGKFFLNEASSELDHARKLQDFLISWNLIPVLPQVETNHTFADLVDIINKSYKLELDLYKKYELDSRTAFQKDIPSFDVLSKFREIQRTSVAEYSDLLNALLLIDPNDKFQLLYFEQTYFE